MRERRAKGKDKEGRKEGRKEKREVFQFITARMESHKLSARKPSHNHQSDCNTR